MLKQLLEVLANLTGISKTELEEKLNQNSSEETGLDPKIVASVIKATVGDKLKTVSDDQFKRGQKDKSKTFESLIKKKAGISSSAIGEDLIDEAVAAISAKKEGEKVELSEEEILKHPFTKKALDNRTAELKKIHSEEIQKKEKALIKEKQASLISKVLSTAQKKLLAKKAKILNDDQSIDSKKWNFTERMIKGEKWGIDEKGNIIPIDSEGNQLEDEHFTKITFEQRLEALNPYGFHEIDPTKKSAEPGTKKDIKKTNTGGKYNHKSASELAAFIMDKGTTKEQRVEAQKEFAEAQKVPS